MNSREKNIVCTFAATESLHCAHIYSLIFSLSFLFWSSFLFHFFFFVVFKFIHSVWEWKILCVISMKLHAFLCVSTVSNYFFFFAFDQQSENRLCCSFIIIKKEKNKTSDKCVLKMKHKYQVYLYIGEEKKNNIRA